MDHAEGHQVDDVVQCPTNMHKPVSSVARVSFEHCGRKVEKPCDTGKAKDPRMMYFPVGKIIPN